MTSDKIDGWAWGYIFGTAIAQQTGIRITKKPDRPIRYICNGGDKVDEITEYFKGAEIKIIHWGGTDVLNALQKGYTVDMEVYKNTIHWADGFNLIPELRKMGMDASMVTWTPKNYPGEVLPLGDRVCVYMPPARHEFYRYDLMREVEQRYGKDFIWLDAPADKLDTVDVIEIMKQCKTLIRAPLHDGLSHTAMEFLVGGRSVLNTQNLPYCVTIEARVEDILQKIDLSPIPEASYFWQDFISTHHIKKEFINL